MQPTAESRELRAAGKRSRFPESPRWRLGLSRGAAWGIAATLVGTLACRRQEPGTGAAASAAPSASVPARRSAPNAEQLAEGIPVEKTKVDKAVNPKGEAPYAGATGVVVGTVSIKGDEAPVAELRGLPPSGCDGARAEFGRLFREGMMRSLADVLVTVTGYDGYVPAKGPVVEIGAKGCSWGSRTLAVTFGQRFEVKSLDGMPYLPKLAGSGQTAVIAAIPGGDAVKIYPDRPAAHFHLVDIGKEFIKADVFVLKYATFDVTGLDGKFRIERVPVGKVKVGAVMPSTFLTAEKSIDVEAGKEVVVDLEIFFDAKEHTKKSTPPPRPTIH